MLTEKKPSAPFLCYSLTVKMAPSIDKTAAIAAATLSSLAATTTHSSISSFWSSFELFQNSWEQLLLAPPAPLPVKEAEPYGIKWNFKTN